MPDTVTRSVFIFSEWAGSADVACIDNKSVDNKREVGNSLFMFWSPQKLIDAVKGLLGLNLANKVFAFGLQALAQDINVGVK